jgi:hypothetical protein
MLVPLSFLMLQALAYRSVNCYFFRTMQENSNCGIQAVASVNIHVTEHRISFYYVDKLEEISQDSS